MTQKEYEIIQMRLSRKIIPQPSNKEDEYNRGILSAKSIIKEIYENQNTNNKEY